VHRVEGGASLEAFPTSSRTSADGAMINQLCEAGRTAGRAWLDQHFDAIGVRGTVDIQRDYLDDTRMELPLPADSVPRSVGRGFRPWLARLLRQQRT
jgi:NTE family protein